MGRYIIPDETRYYLDAILHTFVYPDRVNDIRGRLETIVRAEKGDLSDKSIYRLSLSIQAFLSQYEFGHEEDYVFIIDKKGMDLKECGSLAAYEEWENRK